MKTTHLLHNSRIIIIHTKNSMSFVSQHTTLCVATHFQSQLTLTVRGVYGGTGGGGGDGELSVDTPPILWKGQHK